MARTFRPVRQVALPGRSLPPNSILFTVFFLFPKALFPTSIDRHIPETFWHMMQLSKKTFSPLFVLKRNTIAYESSSCNAGLCIKWKIIMTVGDYHCKPICIVTKCDGVGCALQFARRVGVSHAVADAFSVRVRALRYRKCSYSCRLSFYATSVSMKSYRNVFTRHLHRLKRMP